MEDTIYYSTSGDDRVIQRRYLPSESRDVQLDVMRTWFFQNFEDPAERTPYETKEGGYIWIWGGPFDAREELESEFSGLVPDEVIAELADELSDVGEGWAPTPKPSDYDSSWIADIATIPRYYQNFEISIVDIRTLIDVSVDSPQQECLLRLLFANVITAMETYLSDAFISLVLADDDFLRTFVETSPGLGRKKIPVSEIYKTVDEMHETVRLELARTVWHNLKKVRQMYRDALGIDFRCNLEDIEGAVAKRHDIVHRNGKTKSGDQITIAKADLTGLISKVDVLIREVDSKVKQARTKHDD